MSVLERCTLCPRACGVRRDETGTGFCKSGSAARIARADLHFWEEPPISGKTGAGAVFFTGCSLGCVYCQNREISRGENRGRAVTPRELADIFRGLEERGAACIDLVTAGHFVLPVIQALSLYRPGIPVVYNSSGYERVETLRLLEGLVDVYLPDFKYMEPELARALSGAADYPEVCRAAIGEMLRQTGPQQVREDGILTRGVLIRHLILPGHTKNSLAVLEEIARCFPGVPVSLMAQYTPPGVFPEQEQFPELGRTLTQRELEKVQDRLFALGLDGFVQDRTSARDSYLPDFHQFD